ncbi:MAG: hypothetical protein AMXMBFR84_00080 [Candidatus Hydrogenedentota bacterium]
MRTGKPRILIVRLSAIGDVIRTLPALHVIREAQPEARIDWAVEPKSASILEGHPALDEVIVFPRSSGFAGNASAFWKFLNHIRRNRYDVVLDFHGIFKSGLLTWYSGAKERYGFAPPRSQEMSWYGLNRRIKLPSQDLNRVDENLRLCQAFVKEIAWPNTSLYVPTDVQEEVDDFFDATFDGGKLVVAMHVPVDRPEKQWPLGHFADLTDMLLADGRFEVLLTWGPGQFEVAQAVYDLARRKPIMAPHTPDLKHYAWLVHRAAMYFGSDTGNMHVAASMGVPVVALFGPTDPAKHAPYRHPHRALRGDNSGNSSMDAISVDSAYDACIGLLFVDCAKKPASPNSSPA